MEHYPASSLSNFRGCAISNSVDRAKHLKTSNVQRDPPNFKSWGLDLRLRFTTHASRHTIPAKVGNFSGRASCLGPSANRHWSPPPPTRMPQWQAQGPRGIVLCLARPQAASRAKPGRDDGSIVALARLACLKSQSQAVRPRLFSEFYVSHLLK